MKLSGRFYEVTQLESFVERYVTNGAPPVPESLRPVCDARITLQAGDQSGFSRQPLAETRTDDSGRFEIQTSVPADHRLFLSASGHDHAGQEQQQRFGCWYRSSPFVGKVIDERQQDIFVAPLTIPNESGFTQSDLDVALAETKKRVADLEWITGTITDNGIALRCGGKGAKASGRLRLTPDQSGDLSRLLAHSVEDFRLDLPGPSWLVGLLVSRDSIEQSLRSGLNDLAGLIGRRLHQRALKLFTDQMTRPDSMSLDQLARETTVSLGQLRHTPLPGEGSSNVTYAITGEVYLGFPRKVQ